jgi:hypothetical protein
LAGFEQSLKRKAQRTSKNLQKDLKRRFQDPDEGNPTRFQHPVSTYFNNLKPRGKRRKEEERGGKRTSRHCECLKLSFKQLQVTD